MKKVTTQVTKFQYFYPATVALVGARAGERTNFMSCAWHSALSFNPPLYGVLVAKKRFTHGMIIKAREFTVNFLGYEQSRLSARMGRTSGRDLDKIEASHIKLLPAKVIQSPIVGEAYASFECRLLEARPYGDHDLVVGEVLAVWEDSGAFDADGRLNTGKIRPLLYLGCDYYLTADPDTVNHVLPE
jgi:flavin reductase (DIM6/NTAB) family NADH-FMN oxidoreductase RutF